MTNAKIPAITLIWSGIVYCGTVSLLSWTQNEKIILNMQNKTAIRKTLPKIMVLALSRFFSLSFTFFDIFYSN
jgi:hypothetical protein